MLNKVNRLRKDKEFKKVFRFSRPAASGNLAVRTAPNKNGVTRVGFVISNKIDKRASRRNSLKRRLRAAARELISTLKSGYDVVVVVRTSYGPPLDYDVIKRDLAEGLKKSGVINA